MQHQLAIPEGIVYLVIEVQCSQPKQLAINAYCSVFCCATGLVLGLRTVRVCL